MTYDDRTKHFIKEIRNLSQIIDLRLTNKALSLLLESMNAANGFTRHDGSDYYVHPIAVAQTALDFQLIANRIRAGKVEEADLLLAGCLLHDYLEDVNPDKFALSASGLPMPAKGSRNVSRISRLMRFSVFLSCVCQ